MRFAWQTILRLGKVNSFTLLSLLRIVDFSCEESACGFLFYSPHTLSKLHWSFFTMGEIGHSEVLLELVHNTEIWSIGQFAG